MSALVETLNSKQHDALFWYKAAAVSDFPDDGGACIKYKDYQVAVFNFDNKQRWYACQNLCPHKKEMALARGLTGSCKDEPKVTCPFHKKSFSLHSGKNLNQEAYSIKTFPVKVEEGHVYVGFDRSY
ncbi:nitrite reductase small subunit NirD [Belliella kenyensis]|uniref:Nitrite reductase small subunit NirD n=1 Tax=Belliella kenyensis TaxID=1472724 RepID=A0ABV8EN50_9BACT|nr:nitrite reductase small subunit NirD [Belliella kenyensis]MCH7400820.1 nitrite reductase small subunit NirD [Belliella kenyensis]MDN3601892.1 nitrite reductase small subunit NirD [Belliella kenyensis]